MTDGILCGWRISSELPLPELAPWQGDDRPADVVVRFGEVPGQLDDAVLATPFIRIGRDGRCLVLLPQVARYLLAGESEIVIAPAPAAAAAEIRLFVLDTLLGMLCLKRGLYPLHAAAVRMDGGAIAFAGVAGAGKSMQAALFAARGCAVLADDICAVDTAAAPTPAVRPSFPRLKLWGDCLEALRIAAPHLEPIRPGIDKYAWLHHDGFGPQPLPLKAIVVLRDSNAVLPEACGRIASSANVLQSLRASLFRPSWARALGCEAAIFAAETRLASTVPVYRLCRRRDFARSGALAERLAELVAV